MNKLDKVTLAALGEVRNTRLAVMLDLAPFIVQCLNSGKIPEVLSEHSVTYSADPKADFDFWQMLASSSWSVHGWNTCSWREDGEMCGVTCPSLPLLLVTTKITTASFLLLSSCVKGVFRTARANGHGIFSQRTLKSRELTERFLSKVVKESRCKT